MVEAEAFRLPLFVDTDVHGCFLGTNAVNVNRFLGDLQISLDFPNKKANPNLILISVSCCICIDDAMGGGASARQPLPIFSPSLLVLSSSSYLLQW